MRQVYWNGDFIPESEAKVSIYDSALMFGDTVFEMTRSFNKQQFKLKEHLERLYKSLKYISLDIKLSISEFEDACYKTIEKNDPFFKQDDEHRLMINITRGLLSTYNSVDVSQGPNIIIADFPLRWTVKGMGKLYDEGINVVIPSQRTIPSHLIDPKVKNRSRLHYLLANIEVSNYSGTNNWALLMDTDNFIAEGTGSNFFIIKDKSIITPEPRNILRGISRDYVINIANKLNYEVKEQNISCYDLLEADEAFMTATPFCMLPVVSVNSKTLGIGKPGPIFNSLLEQWSKTVNLNIKHQIQTWDSENKDSENSMSAYKFNK